MKKKQTDKHWPTAVRWMLLAVWLSCQLPAVADSQAIQVTLPDGTSLFFLLEEAPTAKYEGSTLVMTSQTMEVRVNLDNDARVKVVYVDVPDGIEEVPEALQPTFRIDSHGLEAMGLEPDSPVRLYDLQGVLVAKAVVGNDGSVWLPISGKGIFVVKTSVSSFKIKK